MKITRKQNLVAAAFILACALVSSTTTRAQDKPIFDSSFTLADNNAVSSDGGAGTES